MPGAYFFCLETRNKKLADVKSRKKRSLKRLRSSRHLPRSKSGAAFFSISPVDKVAIKTWFSSDLSFGRKKKEQTRRVKRAIKIFLRKKAGGKTRPGKNLSFYVWAGSRKHRKGERDKNRKVLHTEKPSVARKSSTTFLKDHSNCRDAGI